MTKLIGFLISCAIPAVKPPNDVLAAPLGAPEPAGTLTLPPGPGSLKKVCGILAEAYVLMAQRHAAAGNLAFARRSAAFASHPATGASAGARR